MAEWFSRLTAFAHGPVLPIAAAVVAATLFTAMLNGGSSD